MHKTSIQANLHITISILNSKVEFYVCTSFAQTVTNVKPLRTVPCCLLYQSTLWRWEVEWQWDILKPFNNLLLLYDSVLRDKLSFLMLIGLQIHRVKEIHRIYDADTAKIKNDFFKMQVSPTHSSTVQSSTKALMSCPYCCPIFTSLYRMSCIEIGTIGIKLQAAAWVRDLNYPVVPTCPPHCEQTQRPSHSVFGNRQRSVWHNSHMNNVSSKGLCRCKCMYTRMRVCTFINSV
jgi:hypothetical protein